MDDNVEQVMQESVSLIKEKFAEYCHETGKSLYEFLTEELKYDDAVANMIIEDIEND